MLQYTRRCGVAILPVMKVYLSPGLRPYVWMLCGCFWFAMMGLLTHDLGREISPGGPPSCPWPVVAFVRSIVATLFAALMARAAGATFVVFTPRILWVRSLSGSVSMMATFYALSHLHVTDVLTLTNTFPIWVALLSWPLAAEKPTLGVWFAVLFSVAGVAVAIRPHGDSFQPVPTGFALFAAFFTAVAMMGLNRLRSVHPLAVVTHFSAVCTVFGAIGMIVAATGHIDIDAAGDPDWHRHPLVWLEIIGVGMTATIGQLFLTLAFSRGTATKVSVVGLAQVVMVMGFEIALGWKLFEPTMLLGTTMVLLPVAWLMTRERRERQRAIPAVEEAAIE